MDNQELKYEGVPDEASHRLAKRQLIVHKALFNK